MAGRVYLPLEARFLNGFVQGAPDECWLWRGGVNARGRPYLRIGGKAGSPKVLVHRYAYARHHGIILPPGRKVTIRHTCDRPRCVNPAHLLAGTQRDNVRDMDDRGRRAVGNALPMAVLTPKLVRLYRRLLAQGYGVKKLARDVGVSDGALRAMRDRRTWRHVP